MEGQPPSYAETLRAAIKAAGSSRRKLSVELPAKTGATKDSEYRSLGKYLSGDEIPGPERAAILAVELKEPRLALVSSVAERRRGRQAELEAKVDVLSVIVRSLVETSEALREQVIGMGGEVPDLHLAELLELVPSNGP